MTIGVTELFLFVGFASLAVEIWAIVDAARRPSAAWAAIGKSKATWIALIAVFAVFCGLVGLILAIVYLATIKPELQKAPR
jgi:hypothetical protein